MADPESAINTLLTSQSKHKASQIQIHKEQKNVVQRFAQSNTPNVIAYTSIGQIYLNAKETRYVVIGLF